MQSKIADWQLEILNEQLRVLRNRHLMILWFIVPAVLACLTGITWILEKWLPDYLMGDIYYVGGGFMIVTGSISLAVYHYIAIEQINFHETVTETTLVYLRTLRRNIRKKLSFLLWASIVFYLFFSAGLFLMVFRWIPSWCYGGIIGAYNGCSLALSSFVVKPIVRRFIRVHRPILRSIRTLI
jgi:hypothetical protein